MCPILPRQVYRTIAGLPVVFSGFVWRRRGVYRPIGEWNFMEHCAMFDRHVAYAIPEYEEV